MEKIRDSYEFPTDLADDADGGALGWTVCTIALATLLLALTNAQSLRGWAEDFPPDPAALRLVQATSAWEEATAELGLASGRARMHKAWRSLEDARWTPREPEIREARR